MLAPFHVNIFARPADASEGPAITLDGISVTPLQSTTGTPLTYIDSLPLSFEHVYEALLKLPRLDAEPDGFFVLAGGAAATHWSISGHLYDFNGRLHRMELNGRCPQESFDAILACVGWPRALLTFELVEQGMALDEPAFRAWAAGGRLAS